MLGEFCFSQPAALVKTHVVPPDTSVFAPKPPRVFVLPSGRGSEKNIDRTISVVHRSGNFTLGPARNRLSVIAFFFGFHPSPVSPRLRRRACLCLLAGSVNNPGTAMAAAAASAPQDANLFAPVALVVCTRLGTVIADAWLPCRAADHRPSAGIAAGLPPFNLRRAASVAVSACSLGGWTHAGGAASLASSRLLVAHVATDVVVFGVAVPSIAASAMPRHAAEASLRVAAQLCLSQLCGTSSGRKAVAAWAALDESERGGDKFDFNAFMGNTDSGRPTPRGGAGSGPSSHPLEGAPRATWAFDDSPEPPAAHAAATARATERAKRVAAAALAVACDSEGDAPPFAASGVGAFAASASDGTDGAEVMVWPHASELPATARTLVAEISRDATGAFNATAAVARTQLRQWRLRFGTDDATGRAVSLRLFALPLPLPAAAKATSDKPQPFDAEPALANAVVVFVTVDALDVALASRGGAAAPPVRLEEVERSEYGADDAGPMATAPPRLASLRGFLRQCQDDGQADSPPDAKRPFYASPQGSASPASPGSPANPLQR